jgi:hypothetical protein
MKTRPAAQWVYEDEHEDAVGSRPISIKKIKLK